MHGGAARGGAERGGAAGEAARWPVRQPRRRRPSVSRSSIEHPVGRVLLYWRGRIAARVFAALATRRQEVMAQRPGYIRDIR
jgi:hypothetical protein